MSGLGVGRSGLGRLSHSCGGAVSGLGHETKSGHACSDRLLLFVEDLEDIQHKNEQGRDNLGQEVRSPQVVRVDFVSHSEIFPDDKSATSRKDTAEKSSNENHLQNEAELTVVLLGSDESNTDSDTIKRESDGDDQEEETNDSERNHIQKMDGGLHDEIQETSGLAGVGRSSIHGAISHRSHGRHRAVRRHSHGGHARMGVGRHSGHRGVGCR